MDVAIVGTDTAVGKTHVHQLLVRGLRLLGRSVWMHKPVACGDWQDGHADDTNQLLPYLDNGQTLETLCGFEFSEAASPHLAAAAAETTVKLEQLIKNAQACQGDHDLILEGAGGVCAPLCSNRQTIIPLLHSLKLPVLLVTRPHLGTLNHTCLTVAFLRANSIPILGLVVNEHEQVNHESLAIRTVKSELEALTNCLVLYTTPWNKDDDDHAEALAAAVLAQHC